MNPAGTIAYVGNFAGSSVSVIDTSDNSVTATYMLRGGVGELALNPSGTELYVGSPDSTLITVLDTSDGSVVGSVIAGNGIVSMAFSPDGTRLYVANSTDGSISVVDTSTLSVLTTVTFSFGVTVSPFSLVADASYLYVGLAEGVILVLDRVTNTLLEGAPLPVDQYPKDMFFDSSGRLYVSTVYDDFIYVLDVSTPAELVIDQEIEMPNDIMGMALNPAGTLLYVTMNTSDEVKVIDVSDYSIVDTFATAVNPYDIAFSSSTGGAYVVSQDEDSVEVFC
jgi:YVTN family beta-propeller protein